MTEPSWLEIDLDALEHNARAIGTLLGEGCRTCAVVKKDAYGLGAVTVAHRLMRAGVDMFCVFGPDEAEQLIQGAVTAPILMLMPLREIRRTDLLYRHAVADKLHISIHDLPQLTELNQIGRTFGIKLPVHLYLDTGMSRSGLNTEQFTKAVGMLPDLSHIRVAGVFTHMATSSGDPAFADEQMAVFTAALEAHRGVIPGDAIRHTANTFSMLRDTAFHLDMVRPGLGLYGYGPELLAPGKIIAEVPVLKPIVRWVSRVIHVQRYDRGTPVGYGCTHKLRRHSVIGVVPVGYGDGYPVALSNKAVVRVHDVGHHKPIAECRVLGMVNMDQITIDLTDVAGDNPELLTNAWVEVYSPDPAAGNNVSGLCQIAKTHPYEMLTRLSPNLKRRYLGSGSDTKGRG